MSALIVTRKTGQERFHSGGQPFAFELSDFWKWADSDLVSNALRGRLAEYIVARALGVAEGGLRREWDSFDLTSHSGARVEVKSSAYVQTWHQERESALSFDIRRTRAWDSHSNKYETEIRRQADIYVFCVLHHRDRETIDPLDVSQWTFFVVPTRTLNERHSVQNRLSLAALRALGAPEVPYNRVAEVVDEQYTARG